MSRTDSMRHGRAYGVVSAQVLRAAATLPARPEGGADMGGGRTASTNVTPHHEHGVQSSSRGTSRTGDTRRAGRRSPRTPRPAAPRRLLSEPLVTHRRQADRRQTPAGSRHRRQLIREPTSLCTAIPGQNPAGAALMHTARQDVTNRARRGDRRFPWRIAARTRQLRGECARPTLRRESSHWWRGVPGRSPHARRVSPGRRTGARPWPARATTDPLRGGSRLCARATEP
jgi:hypothetical protein